MPSLVVGTKESFHCIRELCDGSREQAQSRPCTDGTQRALRFASPISRFECDSSCRLPSTPSNKADIEKLLFELFVRKLAATGLTVESFSQNPENDFDFTYTLPGIGRAEVELAEIALGSGSEPLYEDRERFESWGEHSQAVCAVRPPR